jgi:hypothetical protein
MQVLQAGPHKLILLELDLDLVINIARQAGFEVKSEDTARSLILDLNATGRQAPLLLFDAADQANLGWFSRCQFYVEGRSGVIIGRHEGLKYNEFLRTKKSYGNFVLKAGLRLINGYGNSGLQFRSEPVPDSHEVKGYQADAGEKYWGALYDESRRRKVLAGPPPEFLQTFDPAAWHSYVVTAEGTRILIELDGIKTVDYTEPEPGILAEGFIALQAHANPRPVEVWFKDLLIRTL